MRALLVAVVAALVCAGTAVADTYRFESGPGAVGSRDISASYSIGTDPWTPAWIVAANPAYSTVGTSHWIAPSPDGSGPSVPYGPVHFRTMFFLPAVYASAHIDGAYYADNYATVFVNGTPVSQQAIGDIGANYGRNGAPATTFTASAPLHPGINTLSFDVWDLGNPEGVDYAGTVSYTALASADQCKQGGWQAFGVFKNQGDCVSYVATDGANPPANG